MYKLGPSIRNNIFNYKETVQAIVIDEDASVVLPDCDCQFSEFCDNDLGHIVTGKLDIVKNSRLRKLLSKGPNFREPRFYNLKKCVNIIQSSLDVFILSMKDKRKIDISSLQLWKDKILNILKDKITSLTSFKKKFRTCPTLKNKNVLEYLEELQKKFVIAPIDKA